MDATAPTSQAPSESAVSPSSTGQGTTALRGKPSTLIEPRPRIFWDLDGVGFLPKRRRHAVYVDTLRGYDDHPGVNNLLQPFLPQPIEPVGVEEFWRLFRHYGDIARVVLHGIPLDNVSHVDFIQRNIREEYEAMLARYLPQHMELDEFPPEHHEPMRRALKLAKSVLVTFRSYPDRQIPHLVEKGIIRPGEGMFKSTDVRIVGGGHKAALAKAAAILLDFRDVIDAHRRIGIYPMLNGDALSDLDVALLVGCWFVGFTETGEASRDRLEAKIADEAKRRRIDRKHMPVTLFNSVADPAYLEYLEWICKKWERKVAEYQAFVARPTGE